MKLLCAMLGLLTAFGLVWPAYAHHSDSRFDREKLVAFEARVIRYVFRNPHVSMTVETEDRDGEDPIGMLGQPRDMMGIDAKSFKIRKLTLSIPNNTLTETRAS